MAQCVGQGMGSFMSSTGLKRRLRATLVAQSGGVAYGEAHPNTVPQESVLKTPTSDQAARAAAIGATPIPVRQASAWAI